MVQVNGQYLDFDQANLYCDSRTDLGGGWTLARPQVDSESDNAILFELVWSIESFAWIEQWIDNVNLSFPNSAHGNQNNAGELSIFVEGHRKIHIPLNGVVS